MVQKLHYFFKLEVVPTKLEDGERGENPNEDAKEDSQFATYSHPAHMHNVDLSAEDGLEFSTKDGCRCNEAIQH